MDRVPEPIGDEPGVPEIIRVATELEKTGNEKFKAKQWDHALENYQEALKKLNGSESEGTCNLLFLTFL